jgi:hypothetical protein
MNRSHSRSTFPFDKPVPVKKRWLLTPTQAEVTVKTQQRKQREHDRKLAAEPPEEDP